MITGVCDERARESGLREAGFHIHAFEPAASTFALLEKSVSALPRSYREFVTLNQMGVAHHDGVRELWDDTADGSETSSFSQYNEPAGAKDISEVYKRNHLGVVRVRTVDGYLEERGRNVFLMKIDIEGNHSPVSGRSHSRLCYKDLTYGQSRVPSNLFS